MATAVNFKYAEGEDVYFYNVSQVTTDAPLVTDNSMNDISTNYTFIASSGG